MGRVYVPLRVCLSVIGCFVLDLHCVTLRWSLCGCFSFACYLRQLISLYNFDL